MLIRVFVEFNLSTGLTLVQQASWALVTGASSGPPLRYAHHIFTIVCGDYSYLFRGSPRFELATSRLLHSNSPRAGIGRGIVEKLVSQGISVVLVALPEKLLDDFYAELVAAHPTLQFRKIGVDLSKAGAYMQPIIDGTKDLPVNLVFNNAGFITAGFFHAVPLLRNLGNYECNASCTLSITHHFLNKIIDAQQTGLIAFTSSSAGALTPRNSS